VQINFKPLLFSTREARFNIAKTNTGETAVEKRLQKRELGAVTVYVCLLRDEI
jgi:hypothetical protein